MTKVELTNKKYLKGHKGSGLDACTEIRTLLKDNIYLKKGEIITGYSNKHECYEEWEILKTGRLAAEFELKFLAYREK